MVSALAFLFGEVSTQVFTEGRAVSIIGTTSKKVLVLHQVLKQAKKDPQGPLCLHGFPNYRYFPGLNSLGPLISQLKRNSDEKVLPVTDG